jgi:type IV secretion system protein VirB4
MLNIKEFRSKDLALPDLLVPAILAGQITVANKNCAVILTKDGAFMSAMQFAGPDLESMSYAATNRLSTIFNAAITRLGEGWSVHVSAIRQAADGYIPEEDNHFADPVSALIDAERRAQFEREGLHFLTRYYLVLTWQTPPESEVSASHLFVENKKGVQHDSFESLLRKFEDSVNSVAGILAQRFRIQPLDDTGLLTHYHECLSGLSHKTNAPEIPAYLDVLVGHHDYIGGTEPSLDGEQLAVITAIGYPDKTQPEMLESLHNLAFPLRFTTRYVLLDQQGSKKLIASYREKWASSKFSLRDYISGAMSQGQMNAARADRFKERMEQETALADADASSGAVLFGYFTITVILRHEDAKVLQERSRVVVNHLNNLGFSAKKETVNATEAFFGSLPGHTWENVRRPVVNSVNFVDLSPKTSVWAGDERCPSPLMKAGNKPAPCLTYAKTSGSTPFRFNLHVSDVGHSAILGPTGMGKSSLLGLLSAQWLRYPNARVIAFDKGRSLFALTEAVGGQHYDLGGEYSKLAFAPLERADTATGRIFAEEWLESLAVLQNVPVSASTRAVIHRAIEGLSSEEGRSVTDAVNLLQDSHLKEAIGVYTGTGKYGDILDARHDGLDMSSRFITFEMDSLPAGETGKQLTVPVLLYLFHRIESMLDGSPTLILLDEAWTLLDNPLFLAKIREWLKVLRKKNAAVVFATQSLADLMGSPLLPVIQESCPTKVFLPNVEAGSQNLRGMYASFGLEDKQIELLQTATPKQDYYIHSPAGQRLVSFAMGAVTLAFCAVSDPRDVKRVAELREAYGREWPVYWLQERLPANIRDGWVSLLREML